MLINNYYFSIHKRIFDLVVVTMLSITLFPLWILIFFLILFSSGWPVVFTQVRSGKNGDPFLIYKWRTMNRGASKIQNKLQNQNQAPSPMFKIFDDPRFVGIGKWLSSVGLDETLQVINIIKGEMSIVGPRPLPIEEAKKLPASWNFRYLVRPGLVSEWALSPARHKSLFNWRKLDMLTLRYGGWKYDLYLIVKTAKMILRRITI